LNFVDLDGNAFNSTVPSVFGRLPNLQFLYLSDSFISGDLSYMNGMTAMREHWIDTNPGLTGPVFDFVGSILTLESFSITFSSLTGTLPTTLGQLAAMTQVRVVVLVFFFLGLEQSASTITVSLMNILFLVFPNLADVSLFQPACWACSYTARSFESHDHSSD
jgi:hypothetical protein